MASIYDEAIQDFVREKCDICYVSEFGSNSGLISNELKIISIVICMKYGRNEVRKVRLREAKIK